MMCKSILSRKCLNHYLVMKIRPNPGSYKSKDIVVKLSKHSFEELKIPSEV